MQMKIDNAKTNQFPPQGKEHKMTTKQNAIRTQMNDLREIAVELPENELRIVSGGLMAVFSGLSCYSRVAVMATSSTFDQPTDYNTNGDHDSD